MKLQDIYQNKFRIVPGVIKTYLINTNDSNLKDLIISGSKFKRLFVGILLSKLLKKIMVFILKKEKLHPICEIKELRRLDSFLEKYIPGYDVVTVTSKPNWEKECIYIVVTSKNRYYFVKIIKKNSVLIKEFLNEIQNLKNLRNTDSINFPELIFEFETTNIKIAVTKFVFGEYVTLSDKNILDLGLSLKNLKKEEYVAEGKYFSHCDLAPWNYKLNNSKIVILDLGSTGYKYNNYDKYYYYILDFNFKKSFLKNLDEIPKNLYKELYFDINERLSGDLKLKEKVIKRLKAIKYE